MDEIKNSVKTRLDGTYSYELEFINENMFEYYGIKKLYDLAVDDPEKIYFYMHGKGMFNPPPGHNPNFRTIDNIKLTQSHANQWERVLTLFEQDNEIIAAGMFPKHNLVFFNFFYARGDFLVSCNSPNKTTDRYYYECWLCQGDYGLGKIYNLHDNSFNYYYSWKRDDNDIEYIDDVSRVYNRWLRET